jgi:hypothetical protein
MRFMVIFKADADSEKGALPDPKVIDEMNKFTDELVAAGVVLGYEGLHPSSKGARVHFSGNKRTVIDGPFAESKELIAGYYLWQVKSLEEAIEWVKRMPDCGPSESEVEIRQVFEPDDFAYGFSEEAIQQEKELRAQLAAKAATK